MINHNQVTIESYNQEAKNWNSTRQEFWGNVTKEIEDIIFSNSEYVHIKTFQNKKSIFILDAGCGNGRLLKSLIKIFDSFDHDFDYIGFDPSVNLIEFAKDNFGSIESSFGNIENSIESSFDNIKNSPINIKSNFIYIDKNSDKNKDYKNNFFVANLLNSSILQNVMLKNNNQKFDIIFSIAVFHHFNKEEFIVALNNLKQLKQKDGIIIMTLWKRDKAKSKEEYLPLFNKDSERYIYNYTEVELIEIFKSLDCEVLDIRVLEKSKDTEVSNIYCVLR